MAIAAGLTSNVHHPRRLAGWWWGEALATRISAFAAALVLIGGAATARADVIAPTPSLPLLGVPYLTTGSAGCFPAAGVCIGGGSITLTSVVTSTFDGAGQHILANAAYSGALTTLLGAPLGIVALGGTIAQDVLGRGSDTEIGSWTTVLTAVNLAGPVLGRTLTLALAGAPPSTGVTSITALDTNPNMPSYRISSFFDVFVELSLDSDPPLSTTRGPLRITATEVPEPAGLAVLGVALFGLAAIGSRRSQGS